MKKKNTDQDSIKNITEMDVCDASKHNPQKLPSILAKMHDFEHIVKLRLIYGTNVSKNRKNTTNVVCVFFFAEEKKKKNVLLER